MSSPSAPTYGALFPDACKEPPPGTQPIQTNPRTPKPEIRATTGKKKQARGGDLDVGAEQGVRIEEGDRGQDEETQGETQTRNGLGFPQHLREQEERERRRRNQPNNQREREDNKHFC